MVQIKHLKLELTCIIVLTGIIVDMDKSWIWSASRLFAEYEIGVEEFLRFAMVNSENHRLLRCPCTDCCNIEFYAPEQIRDHLFTYGFLPSYVVCERHGEVEQKTASVSCHNYSESHQFRFKDQSNIEDMIHDAYEQCHNNPKSFRDILEDAEKPLYVGSKYSRLSGLMKLYNVKGKYGLSDQCFTALLEVLADMFPENNTIPKSMYEAKKIMKVLRLDYEKIHACKNDCILYQKEYANLNTCPTYGESG